SDGIITLWIGTYGGLVRWQNGQWTTFDTNLGLPGNAVYTLLESKSADENNILWVGTHGGGLAQLENGRCGNVDTQSGLFKKSQVNCLLESKSADGSKILWVGTGGAGLAKLQNGQWTIFDTKSGFPNDYIYSLIETSSADGGTTLWVGAGYGNI